MFTILYILNKQEIEEGFPFLLVLIDDNFCTDKAPNLFSNDVYLAYNSNMVFIYIYMNKLIEFKKRNEIPEETDVPSKRKECKESGR